MAQTEKEAAVLETKNHSRSRLLFSGKCRYKYQKGGGFTEATEIAWQNKDVISKYFTDHLKGKSFGVYGLDLPEIEAILPTNLPMIQANEMRSDHVLLLADHSIAIVDYESRYAVDDKQKYIHYVNRIVQHYRAEWKTKENPEPRIRVRMVVIYTADIERGQVLRLDVEAAFLSELDAAGIREQLNQKILAGEGLTEEEEMQFIILPMSYKGKAAKREAIRENLDLAERMPDSAERTFLLTGMVVMAHKVMERDALERIRRMIGMTSLMRMLEEEKQQAIAEAVAQVEKKAAAQVAQVEEKAAAQVAQVEEKAAAQVAKAEKKVERGMAKRMLSKGVPPETILQYSTLLSLQDIEALAGQT